MVKYEVAHTDSGWKVYGMNGENTFKTKQKATIVGRQIAKAEHTTLIVHNKIGGISSVLTYGWPRSKGRLVPTNIKDSLSRKAIRNSIAKAISKHGVHTT